MTNKSVSLSLVTLRGRCRGGPPGTKSPLGLPELINVYNAVGKCMPKEYEILKAPVDVFAGEPGCRNAVVEYLGKYPGRVEILRSKPRKLSNLEWLNPPEEVYTFPGLESIHKTRGYDGIPTTFDELSIDHYIRLHQMFDKLPDRLSESQMQCIRTLMMYEMKYLRGCDSQWVSEPNGKFSSLAMLQDEPLTVRVRAGAGGGPGSKETGSAGGTEESGDESSSSVVFVGLDGRDSGGAAALSAGEEKGCNISCGGGGGGGSSSTGGGASGGGNAPGEQSGSSSPSEPPEQSRLARGSVSPLPSENGYIGLW